MLPGLVSLNFIYGIVMVMSNIIKAQIHPALHKGGWWCNGVRVYFLSPFLPTELHLNSLAYMSILTEYVHPFMMAIYSRIMHHLTKLISSQICIWNMTMSSLYFMNLHSHQILIQESIFGMWWNERFAS